jgi:hypothetical protein
VERRMYVYSTPINYRIFHIFLSSYIGEMKIKK